MREEILDELMRAAVKAVEAAIDELAEPQKGAVMAAVVSGASPRIMLDLPSGTVLVTLKQGEGLVPLGSFAFRPPTAN